MVFLGNFPFITKMPFCEESMPVQILPSALVYVNIRIPNCNRFFVGFSNVSLGLLFVIDAPLSLRLVLH